MPATYDLTGDDKKIYRDDPADVLVPALDENEDPFDLGTDPVIVAQIRRHRLRPSTPSEDPVAEFAVEVVDVADLELPDGMDLDVPAGTSVIVLSLTSEQTAALPDAGVWDLQVDGETWLTGDVEVEGDVSRAD